MARTKKEKKKSTDIIIRVIMVVLVVVIIYSGYQLITIYQRYHQGTVKYQELQEEAGAASKPKKGPLDLNWDRLQKKYADIRGWLYLEGTVINYPIAQAADNDYYLHRMINGDYEWKGTLFLDYRNDGEFKDHLTVIYGHRMKDGSMFKPLIQYRDKKFYKKHKKFYLSTPEQDYDIEVFAACTIPGDSERYKFDWIKKGKKAKKAEKKEYLDWIYSNTELDTDVEVSYKDRIVMLSTCTYEFDEARLVVFGKLVPRGEPKAAEESDKDKKSEDTENTEDSDSQETAEDSETTEDSES